MECDWEVEIGGNAPVIDAQWPGFVDLRVYPELASQFSEAAQCPALADTLVRLNRPGSGVWTAKCDVWAADEIDIDELDALPASATCALACYIDVLPAITSTWSTIEAAVDWCRQRCDLLEKRRLRCCRADFIVRRALVDNDSLNRLDLGVTAYLTACASTDREAAATLSAALGALVDALAETGLPTIGVSKATM